MYSNIGANIARLRKEKQITQETLAAHVGVSAQAVSKWENGGVPDTELLPKIADYFCVTIDTLFGRSVPDQEPLVKLIAKHLGFKDRNDYVRKEWFPRAFELLWAMERSLMCDYEHFDTDDTIANLRANEISGQRRHSAFYSDAGFTLMGLDGTLPYFIMAPRPKDTEKAYFENTDYVDFFKDMGDKDFLDTLVFLNKRDNTKCINAAFLADKLHTTREKMDYIVSRLKKYNLLNVHQIEGSDDDLFELRPNQAVPALLIFAHEIIHRPNCYCYFSAGWTEPFF